MVLINKLKTMSLKKRSTFNLSHEVKTSTDMGKLLPFFMEPVMPGDSFKVRTEVYLRLAPMLAPIMHQVNCYVHWFFVPNRLIWKDWKKFITRGANGKSTPVYPRVIVPRRVMNDRAEQYYLDKLFGRGSLYDYLGFPTYTGFVNGTYVNQFLSATRDLEIDLLPFMAYQRIWADYYRDENLQPLNKFYQTDAEYEENDENDIPPLNSGMITIFSTPDNKTPRYIDEIFALRYRSWEKDYFTSALPWAQRGSDVVIPGTTGLDPSSLKIVGEDVPVSGQFSSSKFNLSNISVGASNIESRYGLEGYQQDSYPFMSLGFHNGNTSIHEASGVFLEGQAQSIDGGHIGVNASDLAKALSIVESGGRLDPGTVDEATINNLRRANALQQYLEAMARGGSRYIEQIQAIFGVRSSDARLQRAEYLGGGRSNVIISEVLQQSASTDTPNGDPSPLGEFAGRGVSSGRTGSIKQFFEEHGYLVGIMSIVPRSGYYQGTPRKYTKFDCFDYVFPQFAHLGEQEVRNSELFDSLTLSDEERNGTFGYQSRYAEYKFIQSKVTGEMRDRLDFWHLNRKFANLPGLNADFVTVKPEETSRIYAVQEEVQIDAATGEAVTDPETGEVKTIPTDHIFSQIYVHCTSKRELPRNGTPRL
ncbi:major capsid protein [Paramuribaculum intestinale]|uniref:major capsid protein n=1 Tax=Paramuribaculum intestinale TaxID=2094151 RepID=UPI0025B3F891|nr:major capsid protein [Paramuribaculum intestinale]